MAEIKYTCDRCGKEYEPRLNLDGTVRKGVKHKACSEKCRWALKPRKSKAKPKSIINCGCCGNGFMPSSANQTMYCSSSCKMYAWSHSHKYQYGPIQPSIKVEVDGPHVVGPCAVCGEFCAGRRSAAIFLCEAHQNITPETKLKLRRGIASVLSCPSCGTLFCRMPGLGKGSGADRTCGHPDCREANCRDVTRKARRIGKAKRRARQRLGSADSIDPIAVFMRDGWRCHICGKLTQKDKRGSCHPKAPELEHIVSLADGGSHTWSNLACACRECNGIKGAESFGQLRLEIPL